MKNIKFIVLLFLLSIPLSAQQYNFRTYSLEEGLTQSQAVSIFQDSRGFLWIGTFGGGVCKFDGKKFRSFTEKDGLINNMVMNIAEDKNGNIWFATRGGVSKFDGYKFESYGTAEGLNHERVNSILIDDNGNLWAGSYGGLNYFDGKSFSKLKDETEFEDVIIFSLFEDHNNNIWIGTLGQGVIKFGSKKKSYFNTSDGLVDNNVTSICEDGSGNIWISTMNGISRFNGKDFYNYTTENGLSDNTVWSVFADDAGYIWAGTNGGGADRIKNGTITSFREDDGLSNNVVWEVFQDSEKNIWFGTFGGGICKFEGETFAYFTHEEGLSSNIVMSILEDKRGNMWFGTNGGGVNLYNGKEFINLTTDDGLCHNIIVSGFEDKDGNLWFGSHGNGVSKYSNGTFSNYSTDKGLSSASVFSIYQDSKNFLWFATSQGVSRFDGRNFMNLSADDGLAHNIVWRIIEDDYGNLWFGTDNGLSKYDGKNFTNYSKSNGLAGNQIISLVIDKRGDLWIGSYGGGLTKLMLNPSDTTYQFEYFTSDDGLSDDGISLLVFDNNEDLWIGTNTGLNKLNMSEYYKTGRKRFEYFGKLEGFRGIECNQNAVCLDSKNNLWFGTIKGVTKYTGKNSVKNKKPPSIYVTNVRIFFENVDWSRYKNRVDGFFGIPQTVTLPYNSNHITFDFIGISLTMPEKVIYQYKLEGSDNNWSPVTQETFVTYSGLKSGDYVFKVKSANSDGYWNEIPAQFAFTITPPFYLTWWFISSVILAAMLLIYIGYNYRVNRLIKSKILLEKEVNDRTNELKNLVESKDKFLSIISHDLRSPFNAILGSSKLLSEDYENMNDHERKTLIDGFYNSADNAYNLLNHLLEWSRISMGSLPVLPEFFDLSDKIDLALDLFRNNIIRKKLSFTTKYYADNRIYADPQMIYSVIQNLISNAVKFSFPGGNVKITTEKIGDFLRFNIIDEGVGISAENIIKLFELDSNFTTAGTANESGTGLGILICKEFIQKNNGRIWVESKLGKGSKFMFELPVSDLFLHKNWRDE